MASDLFQADDPQAPCTDPGRLLSRSGRAPGVVIVLFFLLQLEYRLYLAPSAVRTQLLADRHILPFKMRGFTTDLYEPNVHIIKISSMAFDSLFLSKVK